MIYLFRAENAGDAAQVRAIAQSAAKTLDQWQDEDTWWLKVWTDDCDLPRKVRPYASLERRLERREW
ncbi:MAG: hypothetical protein D6694_09145 [Gammaproteobacteria bacterium]|nr:MAG: hypothetical protein D6694_09145 [Gammaproteobacteria bacterium]